MYKVIVEYYDIMDNSVGTYVAWFGEDYETARNVTTTLNTQTEQFINTQAAMVMEAMGGISYKARLHA